MDTLSLRRRYDCLRFDVASGDGMLMFCDTGNTHLTYEEMTALHEALGVAIREITDHRNQAHERDWESVEERAKRFMGEA